MAEVLNAESGDSLESFCSQYAGRVLEMMGRDIRKTASALDVDGIRLISLVTLSTTSDRKQMRDVCRAADSAKIVHSHWDPEELLLMPSIISAFEQKNESAVSKRPGLSYLHVHPPHNPDAIGADGT